MSIRNLTTITEPLATGGYQTRDNRSQVIGYGATELESLDEYRVAAVKTGVFDSDDRTPLLRPPRLALLQLVWPTDFRVPSDDPRYSSEAPFTQRFGRRPEYYSKFGLPGHEGVDIRCPAGASVYACADGVVKLVAVNWRKGQAGRTANHPYGYHVRIRHHLLNGEEYETIYAHLAEGSATVKEGDVVKAGQLIGLGDSTGNVSGAHLHLSLKKIGAKNGGYGELIDPAPFFVEIGP